jgi:hypothetical protein
VNALLSLVLLSVPSTGVEVTSEGAKSVLVLDLEAKAADEGVDGLVRDQVAAELSRRKQLKVLTSTDVRQIAGIEAERQASGCADDSCLIELGDAMGAEIIVYGSVGKLGDLTLVNLNIFDADNGVSLARINIKTERAGELPELIEAELAAHFGPVEGPAETASAQTVAWRSIAGWSLVGIGGAGAVGFGAFAAGKNGVVDDPTKSRDEKDLALDEGRSLLLAAGIAAAVAAGGVALLALGGE